MENEELAVYGQGATLIFRAAARKKRSERRQRNDARQSEETIDDKDKDD
jgi:hypothetical protein